MHINLRFFDSLRNSLQCQILVQAVSHVCAVSYIASEAGRYSYRTEDGGGHVYGTELHYRQNSFPFVTSVKSVE